LVLALGLGWSSIGQAGVALAALFPGKATLAFDGGQLRTVAVGARTPEGVLLVSLQGDSALVEEHGRRYTLRLGDGAVSAPSSAVAPEAILHADGSGHFLTQGTVNGAPVKFLVDTGASLVSIGASDARRAGIDFRKGEAIGTMTANGPTQVWRVKLNNVRIGNVVLHNVDGAVHPQDMPFALLGMSFLNRMEMQREGERLQLRQRY
jgi:aspartyl protease family protein